jgi:predicted dehydrogenase
MHHPFKRCGDIMRQFLQASGRFEVDVTEDRDALRPGAIARYDAVVIYTQGGALTQEQSQGLTGFVRGGGACVGLHSATASWRENDDYIDMIGGRFAGHGPVIEFPVTIERPDHMITARMTDFRITDEFYTLDRFDPDEVEVLASGIWHGQVHPMAYVKDYGQGKVFFLALGHDERAFGHPEFQKMTLRGLRWALGERQRPPLKAGVIGYGASFNMGLHHLTSLSNAAGFEPAAVCDLVAERRQAAQTDWPRAQNYADVSTMLEDSDLDLAVVITPHESHAELAIQCLEAGKHVVTEKPFCLSVDQADRMIAKAEEAGKMLSVFHNRRWDGDYQAIRHVVQQGLIGDPFHIELTMGGYSHPRYWWRSDKTISGGAFFDWGAHLVDWVLDLAPSRIAEISGFFQNDRVWHDVTNEDHCHAVIRFEDGCVASIENSQIAAIGKKRWRILGTGGALEDTLEKSLHVVTFKEGAPLDARVPYFASNWDAYYRNVGDHLLLDEPLAVTPESARRTIAVIETAERSSREGKALPPPAHCA